MTRLWLAPVNPTAVMQKMLRSMDLGHGSCASIIVIIWAKRAQLHACLKCAYLSQEAGIKVSSIATKDY